MNAQVPRKGATRAADIPVDVLDALSRGDLQSATLAEGLALDQARLLHTVFPDLSPQTLHAADAACQLGILKRMAQLGIEFEVYNRKMELLDHARRKTTQKVNLYEKVQIPGYEDAIRKIKRFMEDEENLSKSAQKIVKTKQQAAGEGAML